MQHPLFLWSRIPLHSTKPGNKRERYIPVLLDEVLILFLWLDGFQGIGHFSVNTNHLIMKHARQIEILLQNLLPKKTTESCMFSHARHSKPTSFSLTATVCVYVQRMREVNNTTYLPFKKQKSLWGKLSALKIKQWVIRPVNHHLARTTI